MATRTIQLMTVARGMLQPGTICPLASDQTIWALSIGICRRLRSALFLNRIVKCLD
jgi:hypothetical protein